MSVTKLAQSSPSTAVAAVQANASPEDIARLSKIAELQKIHQDLTSLPQNDAYSKFQKYNQETKDMLSQLYHPRYLEKDKGLFGNFLSGIKSAVWYGGGTTKDIINQVGMLNPLVATSAVVSKGATNALQALGRTASDKTTGVGSFLDTAMRPAQKLVKQPYQAQVLYEESTKDSLVGDIKNFGRVWTEGLKELMPGGRDAVATDMSTSWKKYWEAAADPETVYNPTAVAQIEKDMDPSLSYVAKIFSSKKDIIDEFDNYKNNPAVTSLIANYVAGDKTAMAQIGDAVARYEKAKVSPGREYARTIISLFPHEWEKAMLGDGAAKIFFNALSAPVDAGVTFGLDPVIIGSKARMAVLASKFSLTKFGASQEALTVAFERQPQFRKYLDEAGKLINTYKTGSLEESGIAYTTLRNRYKELSPDVIDDMAKFGVQNDVTALKFFEGQSAIDLLTRGNAGIRKVPLLPRYTIANSISNTVKDVIGKLVTLPNKEWRTIDLPGAKEDVAKLFSTNPEKWASRVGLKESTVLGYDGLPLTIYTQVDKSAAAGIDRFVRMFEIAPKAKRLINISDGRDADQIFAMARGFTDKKTAGSLRVAWIGGEQGDRLLILQGLLKTIGRGMGLEYSEEGRRIMSSIDELSKETYSVSQRPLDLGEFADVARTLKGGGLPQPTGIRKIVQDATDIATAETKATRVQASISAELTSISNEMKALSAAKKELKLKEKAGVNVKDMLDDIDSQKRILGARYAKLSKGRKGLNAGLEEDTVPLDIMDFNAAELDGTQRAIRLYQLNTERALPNFSDWRSAAARSGIATKIIGGASNNQGIQAVTDAWSFGNLYPRIGIRTTFEEVGTYGLINGAEGFSNYLKGRELSRAMRVTAPAGVKTRILKSKGQLKEVEVSNLGSLYNSFYKLLRKTNSKEKIAEINKDPEALGEATANALLQNRLRPEILNTKTGNKLSEYARDFARFNGRAIMDDINGATMRAEMRTTEADLASKSLQKFGPSIALNPNISEALKGMTFAKEFTEMRSNSEGFLVNWFLELNNTIGKRNGQFGNIVLWNANKPQEEVIAKLRNYIETDGAELANRFAIFKSVGSQGFAERIYADATYALRDNAGRINTKLVNAIRNAKGMDNFTLDDLVKFDVKFARPQTILGKELIPIEKANPSNILRRIQDNGYGWVGKQIALLDKEPITMGNYAMYRDQLEGYQANIKERMLASGASEELAETSARLAAHDTALNLAVNRTVAYIDNSEIRTNLAYSLKTFGRYYRATEDFYRRFTRIVRYEPQALARIAILNQTFEDSGFIHKDDKGQLYFTYPGDDLLNKMLGETLFRALGMNGSQLLSTNFGGYVKALTPSLDPKSAPPRLGGPLASISIAMLENLPFVGDFVKGKENILTGGNADQPLWRKVLPINAQRIVDIAIGGDANTEARFSATIKGMRLQVSLGNGPKNPSEINKFLHDSMIQGINMQLGKLFFGGMSPASLQAFEDKSIPKELHDASAFTWNSEFIKFLDRHKGDPRAFSKALVEFATIYPSKLAFTVSGTTSSTEANFQKSYEAAKFVKNNSSLFLEHKEGMAFFIPINGTNDFQSYQYLKNNGFIKNKDLEKYAQEIQTAYTRKAYYERSDYWNNLIANSNDTEAKKYYRWKMAEEQNMLKTIDPMLQTALSGTNQQPKINALDDLRTLLLSGKAPDKKLATIYTSMVLTYDREMKKIDNLGNTDFDTFQRKNTKADLKDTLVTMAKDNPSAQSLYWVLFDSLIGD